MTLSEEYYAFIHALGSAITQWAYAESGLFWILGTCYADSSLRSLAPTYFSIENFRSKLAAVDNTFQKKFVDSPLLKDWKGLVKRGRTLSQGRNKLAHYPLQMFIDFKPGQRYLLVPRLDKPGKKQGRGQNRPPESLCLRDIEGIRAEIVCYSNALTNFHARVRGNQEPFPKSAEQAGRLPTIQQLARQMREALARQH